MAYSAGQGLIKKKEINKNRQNFMQIDSLIGDNLHKVSDPIF